MAILDLAAVIVIALQPAPLSLAVAEVLASETAAHDAIALAELAVGQAKASALKSREALAVEEAARSEHISSLRAELATRRHSDAHFETTLKRVFSNPDPVT